MLSANANRVLQRDWKRPPSSPKVESDSDARGAWRHVPGISRLSLRLQGLVPFPFGPCGLGTASFDQELPPSVAAPVHQGSDSVGAISEIARASGSHLCFTRLYSPSLTSILSAKPSLEAKFNPALKKQIEGEMAERTPQPETEDAFGSLRLHRRIARAILLATMYIAHCAVFSTRASQSCWRIIEVRQGPPQVRAGRSAGRSAGWRGPPAPSTHECALATLGQGAV